MEFAEENLEQILKQRPLSAEETSEMLKPAVDALSYLHKRELAHGGISPATIGAIGDQLKLSTGNLCRAGEAIGGAGKDIGKYNAPENASSPAADVWSLAMTIVEVLTQRLPSWDRSCQDDPEVPDNLPIPLREIARNCLRRDAKRRWTVAEIAEHLNPAKPVVKPTMDAPEVRPEVRPAEVLVASVAQTQPKIAAAAKPVAATSVQTGAAVPRVSGPANVQRERRRIVAPKKRRPLIPAALVFVIVASFIGIRLITRSSEPAVQTPKQRPEQPVQNTTPTPAVEATPHVEENITRGANPAALSTQERERITPAEKEELAASPKPATPVSHSVEAPPATQSAESTRASGSEAAEAGVVHKVMPDVLQSALRTIRGTVRVDIKVSVDESGNVTDATIDSPGPSKYFANAALHAAQQWKFQPSANAASGWLLRFAFTANGTSASTKAPAR